MVPEVSEQFFQTTKRSMEQAGEVLLRQMRASLSMDTGPSDTRLEVGTPAEMIVSIAQETGADLIVLGARGLSPVKELLLGSVSHRVLTHAPCSILVVNRALRTLRHVLLAVEGEEDVRRALSFLAAKPFRGMPEVTLLTVLSFSPPAWPAGEVVSSQMEKDLTERGTWFLEEAGKKFADAGYRVKPRVVVGAPSAVILDEVEKVKPDLVLLGTKGRHGVTRFVLGSVSHAILHRATRPVLIFR
jgi:nucleotide-binding universal stress UspA family protein